MITSQPLRSIEPAADVITALSLRLERIAVKAFIPVVRLRIPFANIKPLAVNEPVVTLDACILE